jgi:hypothetical protein
MAFREHLGFDFGTFGGLSTPAVLHANVACGTHMEPGLKAILEGYRGDIEVIAQALKAEITLLYHARILLLCREEIKGGSAIDF